MVYDEQNRRGIHRSESWLFEKLTLDSGSDSFTFNPASMAVWRRQYQSFPNGKKGPPVLGWLSLGAPDDAQIVGAVRGQVLLNEMEIKGRIDSRTFGLHPGAAGLGQEGSLVFGGYERGRVAREAGAFPFVPQHVMFRGQVNGAAIKVLDGGSKDRSRDKTLGSAKIPRAEAVHVDFDHVYHYMYLPNSICSSLASVLPVTFDAGLGLYIWDEIPDEAIYLEFAISPQDHAVSNPKDTIIRLPLPLIALTMSDPIVSPPKKYFPCRPSDGREGFALGRAFLQGVYMAANWHTATFWMAQAMGPGKKGVTAQGPMTGLSKSAKGIDSVGREGDGLWEASWEGIWGGKAGGGQEVIDKSKENGNGPVEDMTPVEVKPVVREGENSGGSGGSSGGGSSGGGSSSDGSSGGGSSSGGTRTNNGGSKNNNGGGNDRNNNDEDEDNDSGSSGSGGSTNNKSSTQTKNGKNYYGDGSYDGDDAYDPSAKDKKLGDGPPGSSQGQDGDDSGALPVGGIAGIAVGSAVFVALIGTAIFLFVLYRKRQRRRTLHSETSEKFDDYPSAGSSPAVGVTSATTTPGTALPPYPPGHFGDSDNKGSPNHPLLPRTHSVPPAPADGFYYRQSTNVHEPLTATTEAYTEAYTTHSHMASISYQSPSTNTTQTADGFVFYPALSSATPHNHYELGIPSPVQIMGPELMTPSSRNAPGFNSHELVGSSPRDNAVEIDGRVDAAEIDGREKMGKSWGFMKRSFGGSFYGENSR